MCTNQIQALNSFPVPLWRRKHVRGSIRCPNHDFLRSEAVCSGSERGDGLYRINLKRTFESPGTSCVAALGVLALPLVLAEPAVAFQLHQEPSNALSLPTWAIHTSSVIEWATAMSLIWKYGDVSGVSEWKGLTWGMLPCFFSAMCACTWHWFYNAPELQFLVVLQAFLTVVGNFTCWWAAYRIYRAVEQRA